MKNKSFSHHVSEELMRLTESGAELTAGTIESATKMIEAKIKGRRKNYVKKYPTSTTIVAVLGAVLTYYGVEQMIDNNQFLSDHPSLVFVIGLFLLIVTGRLIHQSYVD